MVAQKHVPRSLRIALVFSYLSAFFHFGFFAPLFLFLLFRRHFFVRYHAFCAMIIHLAGWVFTIPIRIASHLFVIEMEKVFLTPEDFLSGLFSADASLTMFFLILGTGIFISSVLVSRSLFLGARLNNKNRVKKEDDSHLLFITLLWVSIFVPFVFYTEGLWGAGDNFSGSSFLSLNMSLFKDPYKLLPGHFVLLLSSLFSWFAYQGKILYLSPFPVLFKKIEYSGRRQGMRRYNSARLRSWILPGWGDLYDQKYISAFATISCFLLGALFTWISIGMIYSGFAEDINGLNANFPWYFLSTIGLRSHVLSDKQFMQVFGHPFTLLFLFAYLLICYLYAWLSVRSRYMSKGITDKKRSFGFLQIASLGFLLHLLPVGVLLLIPITVSPLPMIVEALNQERQKEQEAESEPVLIIPDYYEDYKKNNIAEGDGGQEGKSPKDHLENNKDDTIEPRQQKDQLANQNQKEKVTKQKNKIESLSPEEEKEQKRKGERKKKNYSSYLSIRIRNIEKDLHYWDRQPQPYSAVFEYKVSGNGRLHSVRIIEGSGHPTSDKKTISLIEAMDPVLPPPGDHPILIRELFWNTKMADKNLPTQLKRKLSTLFDGRSIERLGAH